MAFTHLIPGLMAGGVVLAALVNPVAAQGLEQKEAELQRAIIEKQKELTEARTAGIRGVVVNGRKLTPAQVKRELIFLVGAKHVEGKIADFFIDEQIEEAVAAGRDRSDFDVPEERLVGDIAKTIAEFQNKNPGIEFWDAVRAQYGLDKEAFLLQRRQTILFDRLFFPGPATNWPVITREAIIASSAAGSGKQFWDNLEKASKGEDGKDRELPAFWLQLCRGWVQKQLKKWSDIRYPADGLSADVCLKVNGRAWATDEAFDMIKSSVYTQDVERAFTEVVVREALKQALENAGFYLTDEEFRAEFDEYRAEYDETPFNTEVIAVAFKGYPSLEAFRQRWRLIRSYEKMIAADINDENLQAHAEKFKDFFADGQVTLDFIQFMARDLKTGAWVPNGHELAYQRAEAAMKEIEAGARFDKVLDQRGEFYATDKERGRIGTRSLNQLRQAMHETEFTDLLYGYSAANHLYYEAEVGQVVGPLRTPDGAYIGRVSSRVPARTPVSVQDPRTRELVKQDYIQYRFLQWGNEIISQAEVQ